MTGLIFDLGNTLIYTPQALSWAATFDRMRTDLIGALQAAGYALDPAEFPAANAPIIAAVQALRRR